MVVNGDVPLITAEAIAALVDAHDAPGAAATMATMELDDPGAYGRVVRDGDGSVVKVVEAKGGTGDATPEELAIREVNTGVFAFDGAALLDALQQLSRDNAQGEAYLPDVLPALRDAGKTVAAHVVTDTALTLGVNDRAELAEVRAARPAAHQRRPHARRRDDRRPGVDARSTSRSRSPNDVTIEPYVQLHGTTSVGTGSTIGAMSTLIDSQIGDDVTILHSHLTQARVDDGATVGPFAYLRPDAHLHPRSKAGTFVEIKNSEIGAGTKVPHLSYIGDADIGEGTNIGAGNITANYDGRNKHRTTIGSGVRTSVDTAFVAPVTVGDDAYTGAGSVITEDVPPKALGIARSRQRNVEGYADRKER